MAILMRLLLGVITSMYFFPISFTIAPSVNTKDIFGVLGVLAFIWDYKKLVNIRVDTTILTSSVIAVLFSIVCLIASDINNTTDYSYATYFATFAVWVFGAYFVGACIRRYHGQFTFKNLTCYLLGVCVAQCIIALMIDSIPAVKAAVDSVVYQGDGFYDRIGRLYGIGAALDPAGVRFAVVLVMTSVLVCEDAEVRKSTKSLILLLLGFFLLGLLGNMIARTTMVGLLPAILYFIFFSGLFRLRVFFDSIKLGVNFAFVLAFVVLVSVYLYFTNAEFYENIRFAFEGFFNWAETGEWRTDSTDKLNDVMWIWPEDTKTWIIGSGIFGTFYYSTDIGYCRFILYCGLIGFSVFATLFVYNALSFMGRAPKYWIMFFILLGMTFIIWIKVATDIFFIYALFYSLDSFDNKEEKAGTVPELPFRAA